MYYNYQPNGTDFLTPSLFIQKKKTSHEFELSQLGLGIRNEIDTREYDSGTDSLRRIDAYFGIRLKYEYGIKFLTINEKSGFSLHASAEPYFNIYKSNQEPDNEILRSGSTIGGRLYLIPRGTYMISDRWFIDVNFPIEMMNIVRSKSLYNTSLEDERTSIRNTLSFFDNALRFRVGLGLRL